MATIRDVAADAGVSRSTVSYVLSGKKRLRPATIARVRASMAKLGYRPDPAARALALGRTGILGLLASVSTTRPETGVEIFMHFVRSAMYSARERGFDLLVMGKGDDELAGDILADALVVMDVRIEDARLPLLKEIGLPAVLIGYPEDAQGLSAVDLDFEAAGRTAVAHLAELGHEEIAVLGFPDAPGTELSFVTRFRRGIDAEAAAHRVSARLLACEPDREGVEAWLARLAEELPGMSAVVVLESNGLRPLLNIFHDRGVVVPRDCSVLTLSPHHVAAHQRQPITSIDLPGGEMVSWAVNRILDEMAGTAEPGALDLLPPALKDNGSTAPPLSGRSRRPSV